MVCLNSSHWRLHTTHTVILHASCTHRRTVANSWTHLHNPTPSLLGSSFFVLAVSLSLSHTHTHTYIHTYTHICTHTKCHQRTQTTLHGPACDLHYTDRRTKQTHATVLANYRRQRYTLQTPPGASVMLTLHKYASHAAQDSWCHTTWISMTSAQRY
jgi:hypothetical protein